METIQNILTSQNAPMILFFMLIAFFVLAIMAQKGVFKLEKNGVQIGKPEKDTRAMLLKMSNFISEFCDAECISLCSDMANKGFEMNEQNAQYVFSFVQIEIDSWILVNHISDNDFYLQGRIRDIKNVVGKRIGEVNEKLRRNEEYMAEINKYCEDFTKRILKNLIEIRNEETKKQN